MFVLIVKEELPLAAVVSCQHAEPLADDLPQFKRGGVWRMSTSFRRLAEAYLAKVTAVGSL